MTGMRAEPHRKRIQHYEDPAHCRELTFSCYQRRLLLTNDLWRRMLSRSIDAASERHGWRLTAFVFMPEHVHLLVYPLPAHSDIDALLKAIKRPYSFRIKKLLEASKSPLLGQLTIRQRPGVMTFRFWQEGPGYDRNLYSAKSVLAALEYIHLNPVRRGLVARSVDWRWSSARYFLDPAGPRDEALPRIYPLPTNWMDSP
jgi:putative transposase